MNRVSFQNQGNTILGFELSGHCTDDAQDEAGKLVCSAVSSAAYLTANTLTEIVGARADVQVKESFLSLRLTDKIPESQVVLRGFRLHMTELAGQYPNNIQLIFGGVHNVKD